jgi:hypothetical protein
VEAKAFDVFVEKRGVEYRVDTVWATGYSAEEMRQSLIGHDGYSPEIIVREHDPRELWIEASKRTVDRVTGRNK